MKKLALGAAVAVAIGAFSALPASAGILVTATMTVTPDEVTVDQTVTIASSPGDANTCLPALRPSAEEAPDAMVAIVIEDEEGELAYTNTFSPNEDGSWSIAVGPFSTPGVYDVNADCFDPSEPEGDLRPQARAEFSYAAATFEVIASVPTSLEPTTTSSTAAPSTTTTTKGAAAALTTPRFTG